MPADNTYILTSTLIPPSLHWCQQLGLNLVEEMTIPELMSSSMQKQPTDEITGAWPLLWRFNIRPLAEWYYLQCPSAPVFMNVCTARVAVTLPAESVMAADAPKSKPPVIVSPAPVIASPTPVHVKFIPTIVVNSFVPAPDAKDSFVPAPDTRVSFVPAPDDSESFAPVPDASESFAPAPDASNSFVPSPDAIESAPHTITETVSPTVNETAPYTVTESVIPKARDLVAVAADSVEECDIFLEANPFTGWWPEIWKVAECGTIVAEGYGDPRSCHISDDCGNLKDMFAHMRTDAHQFEEKRQWFWGHDCMSCHVRMWSYLDFVRHVCTVEHMERVVAIGGTGWELGKTAEHFYLDLR